MRKIHDLSAVHLTRVDSAHLSWGRLKVKWTRPLFTCWTPGKDRGILYPPGIFRHPILEARQSYLCVCIVQHRPGYQACPYRLVIAPNGAPKNASITTCQIKRFGVLLDSTAACHKWWGWSYEWWFGAWVLHHDLMMPSNQLSLTLDFTVDKIDWRQWSSLFQLSSTIQVEGSNESVDIAYW